MLTAIARRQAYAETHACPRHVEQGLFYESCVDCQHRRTGYVPELTLTEEVPEPEPESEVEQKLCPRCARAQHDRCRIEFDGFECACPRDTCGKF